MLEAAFVEAAVDGFAALVVAVGMAVVPCAVVSIVVGVFLSPDFAPDDACSVAHVQFLDQQRPTL